MNSRNWNFNRARAQTEAGSPDTLRKTHIAEKFLKQARINLMVVWFEDSDAMPTTVFPDLSYGPSMDPDVFFQTTMDRS